MKSKYLALLVAMLIVLCCFAGCKKDAPITEIPQTTDSAASTIPSQTTEATQNTVASESTVPEETEPTAEAVVVESTPDSITLEVEGEDGTKFQVQIGGTDEAVFPDESVGEEQPVQTQPTQPQPTETQPTEPYTPPTSDGTVGPNREVTFAQYEAMAEMDQLLFYYSFADANDFYAWYNAAKAEHEANNGDIIIG